ncbi:Sugar kinase of the NBD/HSP70 family, may contain an N-terminal HTH domain [Halobacillus karajensis]|uniref:N-acetylglucosamine repressor n=1 Tax=Halobacillus karajensis TaxID=195088 RepID=A0A024P4Q7_9BACI|nr:ROK family transcriptional regulator [Halobacillus karajensis]CDQ19115.1 N-acetylglucosamine repressor [Halobacillus karajensis]CDQ22811.1 N-acetylglucosamine repressor [Halobacillus karajensis]CDQ26293.1 N-acetylglucosamine repressor [Halobacillus karajensis]SEH41369.1 Sugar kinase of the NBD/HSP70 family, may contain an N-terminal HTH domain [Halobacillus karajensis]
MNKKNTWNQYTIKNVNKSLVLETILNKSPISRADIANETNLNKGTVSSQVTELLGEGLIHEKGPGESKGGRRPVMLLFNEKAGYSIGIDIGVNYILGIRTDLVGNICEESKTYFHDLSFDHIKEKLFNVIDQLIQSAPPSEYGIVGIGIGVPGAVNKEGKILLAPNLGWENVDIKEMIHHRYACPVIIENEANAGVYGEKNFGPGRWEEDIVYVSVGVGIGVGLFLNGELYRGADGFSGELGHMTVEGTGYRCRCGNQGCWELYASEQALGSSSHVNGKKNLEDPLTHMIEKAEKGDQDAVDTFHSIGTYLGIGLTNIINSFNPKRVIIGNRITAAQSWIEQPMMEKTNQNALWFHQESLKIHFSEFHSHSSALGMAAFTFEKFLKVNIHEHMMV